MKLIRHGDFECDKDAQISKYQSYTAIQLTLMHQSKILTFKEKYNDLHFKQLLKNTPPKDNS